MSSPFERWTVRFKRLGQAWTVLVFSYALADGVRALVTDEPLSDPTVALIVGVVIGLALLTVGIAAVLVIRPKVRARAREEFRIWLMRMTD